MYISEMKPNVEYNVQDIFGYVPSKRIQTGMFDSDRAEITKVKVDENGKAFVYWDFWDGGWYDLSSIRSEGKDLAEPIISRIECGWKKPTEDVSDKTFATEEISNEDDTTKAVESKAIEYIAAERIRQIAEEEYTADHDDLHTEDEIACAAAVYACPKELRDEHIMKLWKWGKEYYKPSKIDTIDMRIRELVKAGALICAEIDRLERKKEDFNHIFDDAVIGDQFKTREGKKAIYHFYDDEKGCHHLIIQGGEDVNCHDDGKNICNDYPTRNDIVGKWDGEVFTSIPGLDEPSPQERNEMGISYDVYHQWKNGRYYREAIAILQKYTTKEEREKWSEEIKKVLENEITDSEEKQEEVSTTVR